MPTRTFIIEAGGSKRFWDVSWADDEVEISLGKWGTAGRARTRTFDSVQERDDFIAAEIRKTLKKGFVETSVVAPVADARDPGLERKVASWRKRFEALAAPAWLPRFGEGAAPHGRVRGPVHLLEGEPWPVCRVCNQPLSAVLELARSRLPDPALRADDLVQLFVCELSDRRGTRCLFDGWLARSHTTAGVLRTGPATRGRPTSIIGWERVFELPPDLDADLDAELEGEEPEVLEALVRGVAALDESTWRAWAAASGRAARNVHKLGGFPTFVQECSQPFVRQLFQLESGMPFDLNLGDGGAGHLLLAGSGGVRFFWASH